MSPLPRGQRPLAAMLGPSFVALIAWALFARFAGEPLATQRSLVFLGGPMLLLSGIHARLFAFLHAKERLSLLPLPISPRAHWRAAKTLHGPALGWTLALGCVAIALAGSRAELARGGAAASLTVEFAWLGLFAVLVEPAVAGLGASLGRRFEESSPWSGLQRSAGGGWTTSEAVVHLYGPALGIGAATLLALPGQLSWERWIDGGALEPAHLVLALAPLIIGVGLRLSAVLAYERGSWEAIPRLAEATVTLAGPPIPEATPKWVELLRTSWTRLMVTQFWRLTPLPMLRLCAVLGLAVVIAVQADPPGPTGLAIAAVVAGLWLAPARELLRQRRVRAHMAAALPLPPGPRAGRGALAGGLLIIPVMILVSTIMIRVSI